ncbi:hypothetical protein ScPMuIL_012838 [Solemya velum]
MASLQLKFNATTIHHWAGILDGRYDNEKLVELLDSDDRFAAAKAHIHATDCIIIDEISMLSAKIFNMVEFVCRHVKKSTQVFGGIQLIASGDFKQLPPVPDYRLHDDGAYCFQSDFFWTAFPHHINLTQVKRQHEEGLIRAVSEPCDGNPSEETLALLRSLDRPVEHPELTRLYGTNFDAAYINQIMLEEMDGETHIYKAVDEGNSKLMRCTAVAKNIALKAGAPVILMKNLGKGLFNGTRGKVHKVSADGPPIINFNGKLVTLKRERFEIFDKEQHKVLACRVQYPLMLA